MQGFHEVLPLHHARCCATAISSYEYVRMSQCGMHVRTNERNRTLPRRHGRAASLKVPAATLSRVCGSRGLGGMSKLSRKCRCRKPALQTVVNLRIKCLLKKIPFDLLVARRAWLLLPNVASRAFYWILDYIIPGLKNLSKSAEVE